MYKINKKYRSYHYLSLVFFAIVLALNYLSTSGKLFPYTQAQVSDLHDNLLAPSGFTFSIWGLIYLATLVSLILPWIKELSWDFKDFFYKQFIPMSFLWMTLNCIWIILWSYNMIFLSLIAIILYTASLILLTRSLDSRPNINREQTWLFLFPVGLHTGWLIFASFTNIMALLVKYGFKAFSPIGLVLTIGLMATACFLLLLVFYKYDNAFITPPGLWALFGIFMRQRPGSLYEHANDQVMYAALILFVVSLGLHFLIVKKHRQRRVSSMG